MQLSNFISHFDKTGKPSLLRRTTGVRARSECSFGILVVDASFKASMLQFCVDALKHRLELNKGETLEVLPLVRAA
ncbi:hypothetical protein [Treponema phagedenis]|uniref:hypothetical protein n=1 Tax=Treponema phagedenis TaxID=162 RepID=UPI001655BF0A|nr:hypothetical protein [Treponema phagedenis]